MFNFLSKYAKKCLITDTASDKEKEEEQKRFKIVKWQPMIMWSWKLKNDNCAICRNNLNQACLVCLASGAPGSCNIKIANCGHAFHEHCIDAWLNTRAVCPLDNKDWELNSVLEVPRS